MFSEVEFEKTNTMTLEPRLREYMRKKKQYKHYNIEDSLIEKEYSITQSDIKFLKQYVNNIKNASQNTNKFVSQNSFTDYVEPQKHSFPSESFKKDKRLDKIKEKQKRDTDASTQRHNYDFISRGYDMYRDDQQFASAMGNDFKSRFDPAVWFDKGRTEDDIESNPENNPNVSQVKTMRRRFSNTNVYKNEPPKIRYKDYMTRGCNEDLKSKDYSLDAIIGNLDNYHEQVSRTYDRKNEMDLYHKVNINKKQTNDQNTIPKRDQENTYKSVPYKNGSKIRDVEMENYLAFGDNPSVGRGKKSIGYPNPVENYFSYISNDIQDPDHVVFERGTPSRAYNKDICRKGVERDVLM